jgi:hypothetical protein
MNSTVLTTWFSTMRQADPCDPAFSAVTFLAGIAVGIWIIMTSQIACRWVRSARARRADETMTAAVRRTGRKRGGDR